MDRIPTGAHLGASLPGWPSSQLWSTLPPAKQPWEGQDHADQALRTILPIARWSDKQAAAVKFTGDADPILPTPFRIGTAAAATVAATGIAASELWETRTGRHQQVAVDVRQATASLRSGHYMKLGDSEVSAARNSIMGVYPTRDGRWSYLHCNFPNHRAAALGVLGVARIAMRSRGRLPPGRRQTSRRPSSPQRAPAAWHARSRNGRGTLNR